MEKLRCKGGIEEQKHGSEEARELDEREGRSGGGEGGKEGSVVRRKREKLKSFERERKEGTFYKDLENIPKKIRAVIG